MPGRRSGILLPVTALPSHSGIGDLGPAAFAFVDSLARTGQTLWQVLPLHPLEAGAGFSPYSSPSAFAGNVTLVSPEFLVEDGLIPAQALGGPPLVPSETCDYESAVAVKDELLDRAFETFSGGSDLDAAFREFCGRNAFWLDDYALFQVIRQAAGGEEWNAWPEELAAREPPALDTFRESCGRELRRIAFRQFVFFRQWEKLKAYAGRRGVRIMGDLPIYVNFDSADVWAHGEVFKLDAERNPAAVAGVPPDYFSKTGQLWGNPVYDWDVLRRTGFGWWMDRLSFNLAMYDVVRIDHFRGLVAGWEVPADEETALNGRWVEAPAEEFFGEVFRRFDRPAIVAEDLGYITPDVDAVRRRFGIPGMKVLLFAFGDDDPNHPYLPKNYETNCVAYTGTHDTNTVRGWFREEAGEHEHRRLAMCLGRDPDPATLPWDMIRLLMESAADTVILPLQDILGLDERARMNTPGTTRGNWTWRFRPSRFSPEIKRRLREWTETSGRLGPT
ncbi:MAG: 4-alpha-glucanotransferase [Acidobacteriota bacterium]|nr:4-alpha-glucanotransferase [Acidobacteriota bacterium]